MDYLTLYKFLLKKEVFRVREIYDYTKNKQVASNLIQVLLKKRLIKRIKHGFYYIIPLGMEDAVPNVYLVGSKLVSKSFFSHYTALELHGLSQTSVNISYISISFNKASFTFKNHKYIFIRNKYFGLTKKKINDATVVYTDLEKTFVDCLRKLKYCVSLEVFLKSFENVKLDFKKIEEYLKKLNNQGLYKKTGYILYLLKEDLGVPEAVIQRLKKKVSQKTYYLENKTKGLNKKNKEWNLMIPKNIEELIKVA